MAPGHRDRVLSAMSGITLSYRPFWAQIVREGAMVDSLKRHAKGKIKGEGMGGAEAEAITDSGPGGRG